VDELLQGLERAARDGRWQPDADSDRRRVALPQTQPLAWDELMLDAACQQALQRVAGI
jgi:beta-N-acetylhexosaminidase